MTDALYLDNDRFQVVASSDIAFDSDRASIQLFPDEYRIVKSGYQIDFPNLLSGNVYFNRSSGSSGPFMGSGTTYCESYSSLIWQEWGPSEADYNERYFITNPGGSLPGPTTRNLPQDLLGTVPAGTNYIDVRVKLSRTVLPPVFMGRDRPVVLFEEGQEINLPGGSCPCEMFFPLMRSFDIVLEGLNVYLRRYQSVNNKSDHDHVIPGGPAWVTGANVSGWQYSSHGTADWNSAPTEGAWLTVLQEAKGPDTNGNKRPPWYGTATNSCAAPGYGGVPVTDYRSLYVGDISVTPGRVQL